MKTIFGIFILSFRKSVLRLRIVLVVVGALAFTSCKRDKSEEVIPVDANHSLDFKINYEVDGQSLIDDSLLYQNDAGNQYKVSGLVYFLSEISLIKQDSSNVKVVDYHYLDAFISSTNRFSITNPPAGNYIGISFNIGVDSIHNIPGGLPNATDNNNMEWPVSMGGGYHIMKFEGYFKDAGLLYGFAMHLGTNACRVPVRLFKPIAIGENNTSLSMTMNLNEWFRNPSIYDFNLDGNYTMGDMMLMSKLSANGKDVFHF